MATESVHGKGTGSTRHLRVDGQFIALLEEDFGVSSFALQAAFGGFPAAPKKQAIKVCEWANRNALGDSEKAGRMLMAWARKRNVGHYRNAVS